MVAKGRETGFVKDTVDILLITYNRPVYTELTLARLLETCDENCRVWIWHNGEDNETLGRVESYLNHPRIYKFYHSIENKKVVEPTRWLLENGEGELIGFVNDDCLMPVGWVAKLRKAHQDVAELGVLACWHFQAEDFVPEIALRKLGEFNSGHKVIRNAWVQGSGVMMKRACVQSEGVTQANESFSAYCIRLAQAGWINGWYYPLVCLEHMDDPRTEHTCLKTDSDIAKYLPLSARANGVRTLSQWEAQLKRSAMLVQKAEYDPKYYTGWRKKVKKTRERIKKLFGIKQQW